MKVIVVGIERQPHLGGVFQKALERLGHEVRIVDPGVAFTPLDRGPFRKITQPLFKNRPSGRAILRYKLRRTCSMFQPHAIISTGGIALDSDLIEELRHSTGARLIVYSSDNPFNPVFRSMLETLPAWDVVATPRKASMKRLKEKCRGQVLYLPFGYDPDEHYPEQASTDGEKRKFRSDAVFMGGCDPDRVPFLDLLAASDGLRVGLYGGYYSYTPALKRCHRGYAYGRDYRLALSATSAAVCLVRRANEDGHVMRTFEIPACAAFMIAERTDEHQELFQEDHEAVFFSSPQELVDKVRFYVNRPDLRGEIAARGYQRIVNAPNTYADRLARLLAAA